VAEANGVSRDNVFIEDDSGIKMGLNPENQWLQDEAGNNTNLEGAWYRRLWEENEMSRYRVRLKVPATNWEVSPQASAGLLWDVDRTDPLIQSKGNGGFPLFWEDALVGNQVEPHRFPYYRAELRNGE